MNSIRILVAESRSALHEGIFPVLQTIPYLELVGKATYYRETIILAQSLYPDILLLDLNIFGIHPIGLMQRLCECCPQLKVLVFGKSLDNASLHDLIIAGVLGYIDKVESTEKTARAIYAVADDGVWFSHAALEQLIKEGNNLFQKQYIGLTVRELDILRLVVEGKINREIAQAMEISVKTVEKYLTTIYDSVGVDSRVKLAVWAVRSGLA